MQKVKPHVREGRSGSVVPACCWRGSIRWWSAGGVARASATTVSLVSRPRRLSRRSLDNSLPVKGRALGSGHIDSLLQGSLRLQVRLLQRVIPPLWKKCRCCFGKPFRGPRRRACVSSMSLESDRLGLGAVQVPRGRHMCKPQSLSVCGPGADGLGLGAGDGQVPQRGVASAGLGPRGNRRFLM